MSLADTVADRVAAIGCSFNAFLFACAVVVIWGVLGPHYGYSDTWQLVINTGTTIVTFLMAFLIAANQQRADMLRQGLFTAIDVNTRLTEQHTDAMDKHFNETHGIAQSTHAMVRELHEAVVELRALVHEVRESCVCKA